MPDDKANSKRAAEGLYDLFLLALMWLREDKPDALCRPGSSIFNAFYKIGILTPSTRVFVEDSGLLAQIVEHNSEVIEVQERRRPKDSVLKPLIRTSKMHNIIVVSPPEDLDLDRFFAAYGYRHAITQEGIEQARSVASKYAKVLNRQKFMRG